MEVDGGEIRVVSVEKGGMDEVKQNTANSGVRSASLIASCRGAEGRVEVVRGICGVGR
jgi:hypothetical protein